MLVLQDEALPADDVDIHIEQAMLPLPEQFEYGASTELRQSFDC